MTMRGANWALDFSNEQHKKAVKVSQEQQVKRKDKKFKMVLISKTPPTWKEVEIIE